MHIHPHNPSSAAVAVTTGRVMRSARWYDLFASLVTLGSIRALRRATVALANLAPGESVLEIGCGTGEVALTAATVLGPNARVVGIDASPEMIAVAQAKAVQRGEGTEFFVQPVERMAFADESFDVVFSSLMMHHLPDTLKQQALTEVARVLKPGGRVIIVDIRRPTSHAGRIVTHLMMHGALRDGVQDLASTLEQAGFQIEELGVLPVRLLGFIHAVRAKEGAA